jgi:hypothetical protein
LVRFKTSSVVEAWGTVKDADDSAMGQNELYLHPLLIRSFLTLRIKNSFLPGDGRIRGIHTMSYAVNVTKSTQGGADDT